MVARRTVTAYSTPLLAFIFFLCHLRPVFRAYKFVALCPRKIKILDEAILLIGAKLALKVDPNVTREQLLNYDVVAYV